MSSVPKPPDAYAIQMVLGAAVAGGKIYVLVAKYLVVISNIDGTPKTRCNGTWGPYGISHVSLPIHDNYSLPFFLESDGDLYDVSVRLYDSEYESRPRTVTVTRLNRSANRQWEIVSSTGNKVFLLGEYYSASLPAAASSVHGNMVYFSHRGNTYAFNIRSRSLTAYFHCQHQIIDEVPSSWLLLGEDQYEQVGNDHEEICYRTELHSSPDEDFGHPVSISTYQPARNLLQKKGGVVNWCPKTPWLSFRHGHDSTLKFFDPCSSCVYALDVPELSNKSLHHSSDGWVLASISGRSWFFFSPFTKEKIDLPAKLSPYSNRLGISLSPSSPDCLVFTICNYTETEGKIDLFSFANNALTPLSYTSSLPLDLSSSSPVYHNGLFYCLGINGNLGVYDPIENSWTVKNKPLIAFDAYLVSTCFLIESDSKLFSVYLDKYDNPIGVYRLDSDEEKWYEVKDLKEKTIFLGKEASFIVPAPEKRMANKICLPVFKGKSDHELRAHEIGVAYSSNVNSFTTREYLSLWIEPRGVMF